jgi:hypothetical protein
MDEAERIMTMPLSPHEQHLLDAIETGLRDHDPEFAAKLTLEDADRTRRRQMAVAHVCLWFGMFLTLTGFALVHDVLGAGVLLLLYGAGILAFAIVRILQLRPPAPTPTGHQ